MSSGKRKERKVSKKFSSIHSFLSPPTSALALLCRGQTNSAFCLFFLPSESTFYPSPSFPCLLSLIFQEEGGIDGLRRRKREAGEGGTECTV